MAAGDLASGRPSDAAWYAAVLSADGVATLIVLGLGGRLLTRVGAGRLLLAGTSAYVAGSLACALAPSMPVVLAGTLVRGGAGGLLAGLGLAAVGGLFPDEVRPRVMGLFAFVWLVPSVAGPVLNATVTGLVGWRATMAWPCLVVVAARLVVGRHLSLVPWERSDGGVRAGAALVVVAGLVLAGAAAPLAGAVGGRLGDHASTVSGWVFLLVGGATATAAGAGVVAALVGAGRRRRRVVAAFAACCLAWYTAAAAIPWVLVAGADRGAVATNAVFAAGVATWALTGLRTPHSRPGRWWDPGSDPSTAALLLVGGLALLLGCLVGATTTGGSAAVALVVGAGLGWAVAGVGMGLSYTRLSAGVFDGEPGAPPGSVASVGVAVAFVELLTVGLGGSLGGTGVALAGGAAWHDAGQAAPGAHLGGAAAASLALALLPALVVVPLVGRRGRAGAD